MNELLDAAQTYARRGRAVFPLHGIQRGRCTCLYDCSSPGKHPLVRRGVHEATTDDRVLEEWWARWPFANVALATCDVVVIDIDLPTGFRSLELLPELPRTLVSLTGGGGVHLFYSATRKLRNHVSRLPGVERDLPGVDLRGNGGHVVVPPSAHISGNRYEWLDARIPIAPVPAWLQEAPRPAPNPRAPTLPVAESTAYGLAALRSEIDILLRTPVGRRNHQLNRSAFALGQLIADGHLVEDVVQKELGNAASLTGLDNLEISRTLDSGLRVGLSRPRYQVPRVVD